MKRCSNPNCKSAFLFGDSKTTCPFCHAPLTSNDGAALTHQLIPPVDAFFDSEAEETHPFISRTLGRIECTGRIIEIEHQALFYSKFHKLFNTIAKGEPFQFALQSVEYTIRVEPIAEGVPAEVTDFCLYGNYLGRFQVGDEVHIQAKDYGHRRIVKSVINLSTGSPVKPGLQISASIIRFFLLFIVVAFILVIYQAVQFLASGVATALFISLIAAVMPLILCGVGLWLLFRSILPKRRGRRRW